MLNTFGMAVNTLLSLFNFNSSKLPQVALFHLLAHLICKQLHATEFTLIQICKFFTECIYYIFFGKGQSVVETYLGIICFSYGNHSV